MTPERDADIVAWWESIPNGERSHILRSLIRAYRIAGDAADPAWGRQPRRAHHTKGVVNV